MEKQEWKDIHFKYKKYPPELLSELAASLREWTNACARKKEFGLLGDWCFENDFNPKYFSRYAAKHEEFKEAYLWAKAWQEHSVARGALTQTLNARFAQFFLGCAHGWKIVGSEESRMGDLRNDFAKFLEYVEGRPQEENLDEEE